MKSKILLLLLLSIWGGIAAETCFSFKHKTLGVATNAYHLKISDNDGTEGVSGVARGARSYKENSSQDTITICKDIRNIVFSIKTITGNAIAWKWTLTGTSFAGKTDDSICGPVPYNTVGIYLATCLVTFSGGKDSLNKFIIRVFDGKVQVPSMNDSVFCGSINLTLDAQNSSNPIAKYQWTPSGQKTRTINVTSAGIYGVSVYTVDDYSYQCTNCYACDSQSRQVNIALGAKASVNLGPDKFICGDNAVTLDAGAGYTSYSWQPNNETSQTISVLISGLYSVTVTNSDGCSASDQIFLKDSCPSYIFIPNAFTPDGNSINDIFNWAGNMRLKTFHLEIYNRWGQNIYQTDDAAKGWDGYYQNKPSPQGVYIYLLECRDTNGFRHHLKGTFTLLR